MNMVKKIINWFMDSNRYKHFLGGVAIGILSNGIYCASLAGFGVAASMEFKDWQWGGKPDWVDLAVTVLGTAIGFGLRLLAVKIF